MAVPTVGPIEAQKLLQSGHRFVDVRTELEFALGHVPGAYNIPLMHPVNDQLVANPDFLKVVVAIFPPLSQLIVGCHAAARSARACDEMQHAGYNALLHLSPGWDGQRDAFGRLLPGWARLGLPVETGAGSDRSYAALQHRSYAALQLSTKRKKAP